MKSTAKMLQKNLYRIFKKTPKPVQIYLRWQYAVWYRDGHTRKRKNQIIEDWQMRGKPLPPPHVVKQQIIEQYKAAYQYNVLVETGTYLGEMIHAQKNNFGRIFSIELSNELYALAKRRFKNDKHVTIIQGDSGEKIAMVMKALNEPAIFWLDGHYSAGITALGSLECPIFKEIDHIFEKDLGHVILIDDARCFTGTHDYPTIPALTAYIHQKNSNYKVKVENDIIQYYPC